MRFISVSYVSLKYSSFCKRKKYANIKNKIPHVLKKKYAFYPGFILRIKSKIESEKEPNKNAFYTGFFFGIKA